MGAAEQIVIAPQMGPQTIFLSTSANIAIYGGGAGSGKSFALLMEPLRHYDNPDFNGMIFRRTTKQVRNPGGLWQESRKLYTPLGGISREGSLDWVFPSGMKMQFAHLQHENTIYDWQGSQFSFLGFDELTHFTMDQFFYMLSRLRSMSGVPGYVRGTCNPDAESWVRSFIDWWIGPDGMPIKERSGVLRWFIRRDDMLIWANTAEELKAKYGQDEEPMSVTFISALIHDNPALLAKNPQYIANLRALSRVERMRLLGGNWNIKETAGMFFQEEWFPIIDAIPASWVDCIRFWDRAATPKRENNNPDWTRGLKMFRYADGSFVVADLKSCQDTPGAVEKMIKNVASHDGPRVRIMAQQDPGSAGVFEADNFKRMLLGYDVRTMQTSKDKITRAKPVSAQAEAGNIKVLRAPWNEEFFKELQIFPDGDHDDIVDTLSGAFNEMVTGFSIFDAYA